jgi:hypothetical protein
VAILAPPERQGEDYAILESVRHDDRVHNYETARRRKDGSLIDVSVTVSPIKDERLKHSSSSDGIETTNRTGDGTAYDKPNSPSPDFITLSWKTRPSNEGRVPSQSRSRLTWVHTRIPVVINNARCQFHCCLRPVGERRKSLGLP